MGVFQQGHSVTQCPCWKNVQ